MDIQKESNWILAELQKRASYADLRFVKDDYEIMEAKNGNAERLSTSYQSGLGIRALVEGAWGFACTNALTKEAIKKTIKHAVAIAEATQRVTKHPKQLTEEEIHQTTYQTPIQDDPFSLTYEEKLEPLLEASKFLTSYDPRIRLSNAALTYRKYSTEFYSTEGANIKQVLIQTGAKITGMLMAGPGGVHVRTNDNYVAKGFEFVKEFDLQQQAQQVGKDLVMLADKAKAAPEGRLDLVLEPQHLGLVIHESIGHPSELDRVLGREADFAGTSFLQPADLESDLQYGSDLVNIVNDPTQTPALGSYGFDDEGVKSHKTYVIKDGIFQAFESDRSTAHHIGVSHSSGNARAHGYNRQPIDRMANLYLEPHPTKSHQSLDDLIADVKHGVFAMYPKSHSINDTRTNFQFTTQMGYLIEDGELTTPLKDVVFGSRTLDFWRNCIGMTKDLKIFGTPNCGKGNPGQTIWTSHGGGHTLFEDIRIGA